MFLVWKKVRRKNRQTRLFATAGHSKWLISGQLVSQRNWLGASTLEAPSPVILDVGDQTLHFPPSPLLQTAQSAHTATEHCEEQLWGHLGIFIQRWFASYSLHWFFLFTCARPTPSVQEDAQSMSWVSQLIERAVLTLSNGHRILRLTFHSNTFCGFSSNWILLYFPLFVCPSVRVSQAWHLTFLTYIKA